MLSKLYGVSLFGDNKCIIHKKEGNKTSMVYVVRVVLHCSIQFYGKIS